MSLVLGVAVALRARGILDTIIIFTYPYMGSMLVPLLGGLLWRAAPPGRLRGDGGGRRHRHRRFAAGVPGPFQGLFNIDLALLIAFAASAVVFVPVIAADERAVADSLGKNPVDLRA